MSKKVKIVTILIILAAIALLTYSETSGSEPINWFPSYAKTDKIPLGTYVSYNLIKKAFETNGFKDINQPPYEFLTDLDTITGSYFFINGSIDFDKDELNKILRWVEKGNTLFISAKNIGYTILDTLKIETDNLLSFDNINTKPMVTLTNKNLKSATPFLYDRDISNPYFNEIDTLHTTVLGFSQLYKDTLEIKSPEVNYIQQSFGEGTILLHTFPEAFGNYFMLQDNNYMYTQNLLAYIDPAKQILWDHYYKSGKTFYTSPLFLLLNNRYLKWAYYFVLIGVVLFVFFEGKRKQRSIPVIEPLKNQTLAFTRTISGMYFEKGKHKEIAIKQNLLFLDYVRNVLRVSTDHLDKKTLIAIAARSNNTIEDTKKLFKYFDELSKKSTIEKEEVKRLYGLIANFKSKV